MMFSMVGMLILIGLLMIYCKNQKKSSNRISKKSDYFDRKNTNIDDAYYSASQTSTRSSSH